MVCNGLAAPLLSSQSACHCEAASGHLQQLKCAASGLIAIFQGEMYSTASLRCILIHTITVL